MLNHVTKFEYDLTIRYSAMILFSHYSGMTRTNLLLNLNMYYWSIKAFIKPFILFI